MPIGKRMSETAPNEITLLLDRWKNGDKEALDRLVSLLYPELRRIAAFHLRKETQGQTLQCTALVHEAYLRLVGRSGSEWKNRAHFIGVASHIMRTLLVDRARARGTIKRGMGALTLSLDERIDAPVSPNFDLVAIDDALNALSRIDAQQGRIVELRFFGGLTNEEAAEFLGISESTIKRDWKMAKAWIFRELTAGGAPAGS
jgi:RNA polymerase sigma factor (TIGR02999 family)